MQSSLILFISEAKGAAMRVKYIILSAVIMCSGCSPANLDSTKQHACERWKEAGYSCIGYEGYQWGLTWFGNRGGAHVWHTLRRDQNPSVIYSGSVQRWGDEYHIYGPKAVDAISGGN